MKMSRACKKHEMHVSHVHHSSRTCECFISPNQLVVGQKHERNRSKNAVLYNKPKYRNFDTGNFSLTLSIIFPSSTLSETDH